MTTANVEWRDDPAFFTDLFRRANAARVPLAGTLELTRHCNLRCIHCYLGPQERVRQHLEREMSTAQVLSVLDQAIGAGCLKLLLTGGDPLLRPDFAEIYRHARLGGLDVTVFTNGTPVNDKVAELFRDLPPRSVEITLYGATAETYERITGMPGSFRRCLSGIERLHAAGIRLGLKTMLMTANRHELQAMEAIAAGFGARFRLDPVLNPCLDGDPTPVGLRIPPAEAVRLDLAGEERCKAWLDFDARHPVVAPSDRLVRCGAGQSSFHVDAYGNLLPCIMLQRWSRSLLTGTFASAWAALAEVRTVPAPAGSACVSCRQRAYCSQCPGLLALENGDPSIPSNYLCELAGERVRAISIRSHQQLSHESNTA